MTQPPDLIITEGKLITFDESQPRAEALAIRDGRILTVGSRVEITELAGRETRLFDAQGATVLPGFIDSHVHLFCGSVEMGYLDVHGLKGEDQLAQAARAWVAGHPNETICFAVQADYDMFGDQGGNNRHALDRVMPDRPFAMFAADHHTIWANTLALEMAGILHGGPVDAGAMIVMGQDGKATGELREFSAYAHVLKLTRHGGRDLLGLTTGADPVPAASPAERAQDKAAIARGMQHCARNGITGLHNMDGNFYQLELLSEMEAGGTLLCRAEVPFHFKSFDPLDRFEEAEEMRRRFNGEHVWCNRVKMFMDGVIDSHTALMIEPYPGTDHLGDAVFEPEHFNAACIRADAMGLQIATHAIGDLAVRRTLDGYEAARDANGVRDSRHRIEHLEVTHPDDLPRLKELGVVASVQPGHAPFGHYFTHPVSLENLHDHQIGHSFAWRDIRAAGATMAFSTDWPVMPVKVMDNIRSAIAPRKDLGWRDQTQTLMETLESYTAVNAWLEFNEDRKGKLAAGMLADVVVMTHDLESLAPEEIHKASAALTLCGGRSTWEA
ncbi:MAG: amidohydrolase [Pseudomonadota bacterium]